MSSNPHPDSGSSTLPAVSKMSSNPSKRSLQGHREASRKQNEALKLLLVQDRARVPSQLYGDVVTGENPNDQQTPAPSSGNQAATVVINTEAHGLASSLDEITNPPPLRPLLKLISEAKDWHKMVFDARIENSVDDSVTYTQNDEVPKADQNLEYESQYSDEYSEEADCSEQNEGDEDSEEIEEFSGDDNEGSEFDDMVSDFDRLLKPEIREQKQEQIAAYITLLYLSLINEDLCSEIANLKAEKCKEQELKRQHHQLQSDLDRSRIESSQFQQQSKQDQKLKEENARLKHQVDDLKPKFEEVLRQSKQDRKTIEEISEASDGSVLNGNPNLRSLQRFNNALKKIIEAAAR